MRSPLISIVVPVFNVERYLQSCVTSLLNQTYATLEIILIDDGSSDHSPQLCDKFAQRDPRITVVHQMNHGASNARNVGIERAQGEYITFVDADDIIESDMLAHLYELLTSTRSDVAVCGIDLFQEGTAPRSLNAPGKQFVLTSDAAIQNMLYQKDIINGPVAKLWKKSLFGTDIRFREDIMIAEDLDLNYRLLTKVRQVAVSTAQKYHYLQTRNSLIRSRFSERRMHGLRVAAAIYDDAKERSWLAAAENRLFMEAIFVAVDIPGFNLRYKAERQQCLAYIKALARTIMRDTEAKRQFALYAKFSARNAGGLIILLKTGRRLKQATKIRIRTKGTTS